MRNNQKRMRGRHNNHNNNNNHRRNQNPLTRVYESNGPEVKIRGTASTIAEKYIQLARDAQSSGDPVAAENFYQHAEHYFRLIAAAQEQFRQQNPHLYNQQQPQQGGGQPMQGNADDGFEGEDDEPGTSLNGQNEPFQPRDQQQPYVQQGQQPYPQNNYQQNNNNQQPRPQQHNPQGQGGQGGQGGEDTGGLPSFITGGQPQQQNYGNQNFGGQNNGGQNNGQNGGYDQNGGDRFGGRNRHRRRHRGPRHDNQGGQNFGGQQGDQNFGGQPQNSPQGEGGSGEPPRQPGE